MIRAKLLPYLLQWSGAAMCGKAVVMAHHAGGFGLAGLTFLGVMVGVEIIGRAARDRGWRP